MGMEMEREESLLPDGKPPGYCAGEIGKHG